MGRWSAWLARHCHHCRPFLLPAGLVGLGGGDGRRGRGRHRRLVLCRVLEHLKDTCRGGRERSGLDRLGVVDRRVGGGRRALPLLLLLLLLLLAKHLVLRMLLPQDGYEGRCEPHDVQQDERDVAHLLARQPRELGGDAAVPLLRVLGGVGQHHTGHTGPVTPRFAPIQTGGRFSALASPPAESGRAPPVRRAGAASKSPRGP
mmetsp:Transcript_49094/g.157259  ORF Transcript_49094/g.157259 Transcript_49094/m.157259 type:complete len:203 (+) Transcript_49094:517-1125(+)